MKTHKRSIKFFNYLLAPIILIGLLACSKKVVYSAPIPLDQSYISNRSDFKIMAFRFVTMSKEDKSHFNSIVSDNFSSHDQDWMGNKQDYIGKRNSDFSFSEIKPIRIIQDGGLVAVHSRMIGDTLRFRWDIVKIENDKILEHWSNVNDSLGLNPDDHSEIDGPTHPTQIDKTDTNRILVATFIDQCMIREDGGAAKFFNFSNYIQHNRKVGDGVNGLLWGMLKMKMRGETIKFKHNFHIIAEGNFVLSATEGYMGKEKTTFFDFFRIEENKIIEHWDIIAPMDEFIYYKEVVVD